MTCYIRKRIYIFSAAAIEKLSTFQLIVENSFQYETEMTSLEKQLLGKTTGMLYFCELSGYWIILTTKGKLVKYAAIASVLNQMFAQGSLQGNIITQNDFDAGQALVAYFNSCFDVLVATSTKKSQIKQILI